MNFAAAAPFLDTSVRFESFRRRHDCCRLSTGEPVLLRFFPELLAFFVALEGVSVHKDGQQAAPEWRQRVAIENVTLRNFAGMVAGCRLGSVSGRQLATKLRLQEWEKEI